MNVTICMKRYFGYYIDKNNNKYEATIEVLGTTNADTAYLLYLCILYDDGSRSKKYIDGEIALTLRGIKMKLASHMGVPSSKFEWKEQEWKK
jgi:hypothetical protein